MSQNIKVAVTGAAGQIGYALLFRIASGQMFGCNTTIDLNLLEVEAALPALEGVVMELNDCAFPLLNSVKVTADSNEAFKGVHWALLVGSVPRKAGMERSDLLKINGGIFVEQGKAIDENAEDNCRVLVVGNPCNTNAFIAKSVAKRIPRANFFAMTMLDQNRAQHQLAQKAGVDISAVKNIAVWGNHSATQYPDFYNATIGGRPAVEAIADEGWLKSEFIDTVQKRGAAIIKARGLSSAASAANAVIDTVKALIMPTSDGSYFSVAVSSDGSYDIEEGTMFSFPIRTAGHTWKIIQDIKHNDFGKEKIQATYEELIAEQQAVESLV